MSFYFTSYLEESFDLLNILKFVLIVLLDPNDILRLSKMLIGIERYRDGEIARFINLYCAIRITDINKNKYLSRLERAHKTSIELSKMMKEGRSVRSGCLGNGRDDDWKRGMRFLYDSEAIKMKKGKPVLVNGFDAKISEYYAHCGLLVNVAELPGCVKDEVKI